MSKKLTPLIISLSIVLLLVSSLRARGAACSAATPGSRSHRHDRAGAHSTT